METWVLLIGTIVAWAGVEGWLLVRGRATISEEFRNLNARWPAFGFLVALVSGLLLGHWFFQ